MNILQRISEWWRNFWRNPRQEYIEYVLYYPIFHDDDSVPMTYNEWKSKDFWEQRP